MPSTKFDLSDVERELTLEAQLRRSRDIAVRAFARGFVEAFEPGANDYLEYYRERLA